MPALASLPRGTGNLGFYQVEGGERPVPITRIRIADGTDTYDVDLDDLNPESLWRFRIRGFGPILVAMDAHGGSLYDKVRETAESRRAAALAAMGVGR